jgi:precorrin-6B methylase 2
MSVRTRVMFAQHRVKQAIKPLLFPDELRLREVRHGPGKGVSLLLNRRNDLQREFGLYEHELNAVYRAHIGPQSVVYDVGAADGMTALVFASLASAGHVFAFEPEPRAAQVFQDNLAANPLLAPRITLVPTSVGLNATGLDEFAKRERPPDFIKVDVDGAELDVLQTISRIPRERPLAIVVETHSPELEVECARLLREHDHEVHLIRNARWRTLYPELRPVGHNRWLLARTSSYRVRERGASGQGSPRAIAKPA